MSTKEFDGFSGTTHEADAVEQPVNAAPSNGSPANTNSGSAASKAADAGSRVHVEAPEKKGASRTTGIWAALVVGAAILGLLLVFIVQNNVPTSFEYFNWTFNLPLGVAMLIAAIAGGLIMAIVGSVRIMQLSWEVRKYRKQQEKIARELS